MFPHDMDRFQGVGTFHINEGETIKATLDATAVVLQNQQRSNTVIAKNGPVAKLVADPPSTGSSTLSNGSRLTPATDPTLNPQKRAASVSSLAKKTADSSTQVVASPTHPPQAVILRNENVDYAMAVKPRQSALVKTETVVAATAAVVKNPKPPSPELDRRRAVAMFTYNNPGSNQLVFHEGDPILVIQDGQQGWQYGENLATGK